MKKNILHTCCLVFLLLGNNAKAIKNEIHIKGKIDSSLIKMHGADQLLIKVFNPTNFFLNNEEVTSVMINKDRSFEVSIKSPTPLVYLSFSFLNKNIGNRSIPISFYSNGVPTLDEFYLFESGDEMRVDINRYGEPWFNGLNSDKLRCQRLIYAVKENHKSVSNRAFYLFQENNFKAFLDLGHTYLNTTLELRLKILSSFKGKFSDKIYNLIYLDAVSSPKYEELHSLILPTITQDGTQKTIEYISELKLYFDRHINNDTIEFSDSQLKLNSPKYLEYVFEKEWLKYKLATMALEKGDSFHGIYNILNSKYTGDIRERLILICIKRLNSFYATEIKNFFDQKKWSKNYSNEFLSNLDKWKIKQYSSAFPFELQDAHGKVHKLADFKGKVLVIDFWFTGCGICKELNSIMHSVIEKYKNNSDVVFMTISTDYDKTQWIKSIATGEFTSRSSINLFTNGLGVSHPIINYYGFQGAPQQLIIDKNGQIISTHPPRPSSSTLDLVKNLETGVSYYQADAVLKHANTIAFMKLIDENIKR